MTCHVVKHNNNKKMKFRFPVPTFSPAAIENTEICQKAKLLCLAVCR